MTKTEQETIFRWAADDCEVSVWSAQAAVRRRIEKAGFRPYRVSTQEGVEVGWSYRIGVNRAQARRARGYLGPGLCEGGVQTGLKLAGAITVDVLEIGPKAVIVNGQRLSSSSTAVSDRVRPGAPARGVAPVRNSTSGQFANRPMRASATNENERLADAKRADPFVFLRLHQELDPPVPLRADGPASAASATS